MRNTEIASLFNEIADFLEIKGENPSACGPTGARPRP